MSYKEDRMIEITLPISGEAAVRDREGLFCEELDDAFSGHVQIHRKSTPRRVPYGIGMQEGKQLLSRRNRNQDGSSPSIHLRTRWMHQSRRSRIW